MAGKTGNLFLSRLTQSCGIYLISIVMAIPVMLCLCGSLFWMTSAPTDQFWIPALTLFCGVTGYFVLLAVGGFSYITYRNRRADAPFTELGFAGRTFALQFRQYDGQWRNRAIHAKWYRGPVVEFTLTLANAPTTFLGMGTRNALGSALSGLSRYTELTLTGEPFDRVMSYAEHPA